MIVIHSTFLIGFSDEEKVYELKHNKSYCICGILNYKAFIFTSKLLLPSGMPKLQGMKLLFMYNIVQLSVTLVSTMFYQLAKSVGSMVITIS